MSASPFLGETIALREIRGVTLCESVYPANAPIRRHEHESMFFSLTLSGAYVERHRRTEIEFGPGSASFHPCGEEHALRVGGDDTRCLNVELNAEWQDLASDSLHRTESGPLLWAMARLDAALRAPFIDPEAVESRVLDMFACLSPQEKVAGEPLWLRRVEEIIHDEFSRSITVIGLARRAEVHPVHLSRTWRRFRGCSVLRTLHRLRIEAACRRMTAERTSLAELALEVGFADQAHFSHVFRTVTGMTPARFRSSFRPGAIAPDVRQ
jgi:AraC family transcriptional regulator